MRFTLSGARLVDATMDLPERDIVIGGEHIEGIGETAGSIIEAEGMVVTPGFIEVHTHGGGGYNLHTTDVQEIRNYSRWVATTGVTSYLIAVVGVSNAMPEPQLHAAVEAIESRQREVAEPVGIHLEGPYISVARRGAHPTSWLRTPNEVETEHLLAMSKGFLRLVTLAPELPGADEMIRRLNAANVTVSMGHTDINFAQAQEAIQKGITHMTHCFNAMRPLLHREPGPVPAVMQASQVLGEVIADGVHVHPAVVEALVKMLGAERTIVVTDAQAGAGLPDGSVFEFAGQYACVADGAARLADGSLTGSVLTMEQGLRNVIKMAGVSLQEGVGMLTYNPARSARVEQKKALLRPGYDADLLILNADLQLQATICRGALAYATDEWRAKLAQLSRV
jgi:N-acetylglucosamine-6-phosphate deacetylase